MRICAQHPLSRGIVATTSCRRQVVARRDVSSVKVQSSLRTDIVQNCARSLTVLIAAGALTLSPACEAQIQTVPSANVTSYAKPIPKAEKVPKETVWVLFIGGAAALFGAVLAVENYAGWFPAIARANQAIAQNKILSDEPQAFNPAPPPLSTSTTTQYTSPIDTQLPPASSTDAVLAGLAEARAKVLSSETAKSSDATAASAPSPAPATSSASSTTDSSSSIGAAVSPGNGVGDGSSSSSSSSSSSGSAAVDTEQLQWERQLGEEMRNASQLLGMSDQQLEQYVEARRALEAFKEQSAALKEQRGGQMQQGAVKE